MKKRIILIIPIVLVIIAIIVFLLLMPKTTKENNKDKIILEYSYRPTHGTEEATKNYFYINVYSNKNLSYGIKNKEIKTEVNLNDEDYNEIISFIYSKEFQAIDKDISDMMLADGTMYNLKVYNDDGSILEISGTNPNNELFSKLQNILTKHTK